MQYPDPPAGTGDPAFFEDLRFREAIRLIEVKLHLIPKEKIRFFHTVNTVASHRRYPSLYFTGSSMGVDGHEAVVEGVVRMNSDGVVRWQFVRASLP